MSQEHPLKRLSRHGYSLYYHGLSSLHIAFGHKQGPVQYIMTDAGLADLARIYENIDYPKLDSMDALYAEGGVQYAFLCREELPAASPVSILNLYYNPETGAFSDPAGVYPDLRHHSLRLIKKPANLLSLLADTAILIAHYDYRLPDDFPEDSIREAAKSQRLPIRQQRWLLESLLHGRHADNALGLLFKCGYVRSHWPQLAAMSRVGHDKEFHPEGNVWQHTLATLTYRKRPDLRLSLALLLHDIGKVVAPATRERAFDQHSLHGADIAGKFLKKLGFEAALIADVVFLVRHHMLPDGLSRLPRQRTAHLMDSPIFPTLLELYRADTASTFRKLSGYYTACREYKRYCKAKANPYRDHLHQ